MEINIEQHKPRKTRNSGRESKLYQGGKYVVIT